MAPGWEWRLAFIIGVFVGVLFMHWRDRGNPPKHRALRFWL